MRSALGMLISATFVVVGVLGIGAVTSVATAPTAGAFCYETERKHGLCDDYGNYGPGYDFVRGGYDRCDYGCGQHDRGWHPVNAQWRPCHDGPGNWDEIRIGTPYGDVWVRNDFPGRHVEVRDFGNGNMQIFWV